MHTTRPLVLASAALALAGATSAQTTTILLREGDELPGGSPGRTITSLSNTAANQTGGWSATVSSSDGSTTLSHVLGVAGGGPSAAASILRTEATIGNLEQTSFEGFFGMDDNGVVCYSPLTNDTVSGATGLDAAFLGDMLLANEDDPIPALPGKVYRFNSRPGVTGNGIPYWVAGIDDIATGANEGNGLFVGTSPAVLHKTGDVILGLNGPLDSSAVDFDVRFSDGGSHYITGVLTTAATTDDYHMLIDGAPITLGPNIVGENQPIDASVPGALPGELWDNFDYLGITEAGEYMFTGDTNAATSEDEFVFVNGAFYVREGETIGGFVISGSIDAAYMNDNGDVTYVWHVDVPLVGNVEALFINKELALKEGDAVDFDQDGTIDPTATVVQFFGLMALGPDATAYVLADIDTAGTTSSTDDTRCMLAVSVKGLVVDVPTISVGAGGTATFTLAAGTANANQIYWLFGSFSGTAPGTTIDGVNIPLNVDAYTIVTLSSPNIPPLLGTFGILSPSGSATSQIVIPPGTNPNLAGFSVDHAAAIISTSTFKVIDASNPASFSFVP